MGWQNGVEHVDDSGASTVSAEFDATLVGTVWSAAAPLCISCLEIVLRTSLPTALGVRSTRFDRRGRYVGTVVAGRRARLAIAARQHQSSAAHRRTTANFESPRFSGFVGDTVVHVVAQCMGPPCAAAARNP